MTVAATCGSMHLISHGLMGMVHIFVVVNHKLTKVLARLGDGDNSNVDAKGLQAGFYELYRILGAY